MINALFLFSLISLNTLRDTNSLSLAPTMVMKPMQKQHLVFFPARFQQPLPSEMYGNFILKLKGNYDIHIASKNKEDNDLLLQKIQSKCSDYDNIGFISHSSGVADLWSAYSSNPNIRIGKIILIEPLDLRNGWFNIPSPPNYMMEMMEISDINDINNKIEEIIETDYVELFKSNIFGGFFSSKKTKKTKKTNQTNQTNQDGNIKVGDVDEGTGGSLINHLENNGKLLVVKHKISDKWKFVPTIPPLSMLNADLMDFEKNMDIQEILIDGFSHFDILDRPWANLMNRASLGNNKNEEELKEYLNLIDNIVCEFCNQ
tara:strand:+ start:5457 stop:6404 length:948 start_codon:yes stop_codon:yes gene_type:complete